MKLKPREVALLAGKIAIEKKATDVKIMDVRGLTGITDFFVLCSGHPDVHVKAISDAIMEGLEEKKVKVWHHEGYSALRWVLLDYVDVVVHIFQVNVREFYGLDRLWGDAALVALEPAET